MKVVCALETIARNLHFYQDYATKLYKDFPLVLEVCQSCVFNSIPSMTLFAGSRRCLWGCPHHIDEDQKHFCEKEQRYAW